MPYKKIISLFSSTLVFFLAMPEVPDAIDWWKTMLADFELWRAVLLAVATAGVVYGTSDFWGKHLPQGGINFSPKNVSEKTSETTEPEDIKESTSQRNPVDRRPLDHTYRILRYMGVYKGEGDERTGISNMLRQSALDGDITIWGVEFANQSLESCVLLKIPPDYWANYAIDETSFEKSVFTGPGSAFPKLYWQLHADTNEIKVIFEKVMKQRSQRHRWDWVDRKKK